MIEIGKFNKLQVIRQVSHGFYLEGDKEWDDILLPNKYAPENLKVGDEIEVFIYFDSEDRIIATTQRPYATVGEFASLEVSSVENIGVFLDWGLEKDLFVPFREKLFEMLPGQSYAVYIYIDSSNRIAASTRIKKYIDASPAPFAVGEKVDLLPYHSTDLGIKAIINGTHSGLIYHDDIVNDLKLGEFTQGYIKTLRDDNKVDLSLRPLGKECRQDLVEQIISKLKESGGSLAVTSKTPANTINSMFQVSRNKFKIALGHLYKKKIISITDAGISLVSDKDSSRTQRV